MEKKEIAALITCHNRKQKTMQCLEALAQQQLSENLEIRVFLVDDGSTDGTAAAIRDAYPAVIILNGNGHLYWCGGMRLAFSEAMKSKPNFYLWLNDDVMMSEESLLLMVKTYQALCREGYLKSIVVGSTKDSQTGELTYGGLSKGPWFRPLYFAPVVPGQTPKQCDSMNGNCVLIPDEVAQLVGNIDASFTHTMGDLDYGLRARQKGCVVWEVPGYVGTCTKNSARGTWTDPNISFADRIKKVRGKRGLPFFEWSIFVHRHGGILWFFYWLLSYRKLLGIP